MQMSCNLKGGPSRVARLGLLVLALGLCVPSQTNGVNGVAVVASFYPLYEFARQVTGDGARVTLLVPPGTEPHDWEPAPADVVRVQSARVFVYNGAGFESWVDRLLGEVRDRGPRVVSAAQGLTSLETEGRTDPHVWLDPLLARAQVESIRAALAVVDPRRGRVYDANASAFSGRLLALHERFETGLARCARREIVVSHAAFAYLARRYRLTQVPIIRSLAPDGEPSPAALAALTRHARRAGVTHVFFEPLATPTLADTLAREVGARTLVLNPIEGLTKEEQRRGVGYVELMDANLQNLRTGLGCQ
jgi:zinc transport system substrate-binding protein